MVNYYMNLTYVLFAMLHMRNEKFFTLGIKHLNYSIFSVDPIVQTCP